MMAKIPGFKRMLSLAGVAVAMVSLPKESFPQRSAPLDKPALHKQTSHRGKSTLPSMSFADVTHTAGIDFRLTCGGPQKLYIMDSMCGGLAAFDYDNDGWIDIFLVNGSEIGDLKAGKCHPSKLYHNNHDGTFTDVTATSGIDHCGWGFGAAVGDYDNDGNDDLYITYLDGAVLYRNNGNGTFSDVTAKAHVANAGRWGTSASFGDYDNDGHLDLYVANYVDLDLDHLPEFGQGPYCQYRGFGVSCGPRGLTGGRDRLFHNNGDGTFTDVTEKLNIDHDSYYGLGVMWLDYDLDGCLDLYVSDDSTPSLLYKGDCKGGFTEVGAQAGVAYSGDGREQAGMGIDSADYDHDGWPDIAKANFSDDTNNLFHNDHSGEFTDLAGPAGLGPISIPFLGFGLKFFDADNDGWPDIFIANGHVNPQVDQHTFGVTYAERPFLFHNLATGKFEEIGQRAGAPFRRPYVARGAVTADFFNDGKVDLLVNVIDGSPLLLRNQNSHAGHWLRIRTIGSRSNHDGFGARVEVKSGNLTQQAEVRANASFESASDSRLHFGLGAATRIDSITIRWPSGTVDRLGSLSADQGIVVEESKGLVSPLPAGTRSKESDGTNAARHPREQGSSDQQNRAEECISPGSLALQVPGRQVRPASLFHCGDT
jgi:enediyne biosynthesis protein E4